MSNARPAASPSAAAPTQTPAPRWAQNLILNISIECLLLQVLFQTGDITEAKQETPSVMWFTFW